MNNTRKTSIALMALLLGVIATTALAGNVASAVNQSNFCSYAPCSQNAHEPRAQTDNPYVEVFSVSELSEGWYKVLITVYAGNEDLAQVNLKVTTDLSTKQSPVPTIPARSWSDVPILIQTTDPATISAELVN